MLTLPALLKSQFIWFFKARCAIFATGILIIHTFSRARACVCMCVYQRDETSKLLYTFVSHVITRISVENKKISRVYMTFSRIYGVYIYFMDLLDLRSLRMTDE